MTEALFSIRMRMAALDRYEDAEVDADINRLRIARAMGHVEMAGNVARYLDGIVEAERARRERRFAELWGAELAPDPDHASMRQGDEILRELSDASRAIAVAEPPRAFAITGKPNRAARRRTAAKGRKHHG